MMMIDIMKLHQLLIVFETNGYAPAAIATAADQTMQQHTDVMSGNTVTRKHRCRRPWFSKVADSDRHSVIMVGYWNDTEKVDSSTHSARGEAGVLKCSHNPGCIAHSAGGDWTTVG